MASESFSLALQQRAAREVVSEEMPRRALATRLLLFCEITSALLIVQLGLFAHILAMAVALIIVPFLHVVHMGLYVVGMGFYAYAALCLGVRWSLRVRWNDGCSCHSRDLPFASIFTNPRYSSFGLRRGQKGNSLNALTIIVARVACASVLVHMVLNACEAKHPANLYQCKCPQEPTRGPTREPTGEPVPEKLMIERRLENPPGYENQFPGVLCSNNNNNKSQRLRRGWISEVYLCSEVKLPVGMEDMEGTCQSGHMDAVEYFYCRERSWYVEYCNAKFRVCAIFLVEASLDTFILQVCCIAPLLGLALMVLIHLAGFIAAKQTNQPSLMNMPEKHELRQRIRTKACHFERQLQKEQLEHSIWYFSALYLDGSLLSLSLSMLSSIFGIANSFYISRHLAVQEYDDVDDETMIKNTPAVCVVGAGEAKLPPPPGLPGADGKAKLPPPPGLSGPDGKAKLPPPPGIKLPAPPGLNPILPAASNGRKPGQFASATE